MDSADHFEKRSKIDFRERKGRTVVDEVVHKVEAVFIDWQFNNCSYGVCQTATVEEIVQIEDFVVVLSGFGIHEDEYLLDMHEVTG